MSVRYRTAVPADEAAILDVWAECLRADPMFVCEDWAGVPDRFARTHVAEVDGEIVATVLHTPRTLRDVRGEPVPVGGIAAVATLPEHRRRGISRRLLEQAVAAMREEGAAWSLLFTGQPWLYSSFGYEPFPLRHRVAVPLAGRPAPLLRAESDWRVLAPIHAAFTRGRPLTALRSDLEWAHPVAQRLGEVLVFHDSGYVALSVSDDAVDVLELAVTSASAARALLAHVADRALREGVDHVRLRVPDDPLISDALAHRFTDFKEDVYTAMALPLRHSPARLADLAAAPHGVFCYPDGF